MKKLIWKLRYAYRIWQRSRMPIKFCWEGANIAQAEAEDWREENPRDLADDEISCWSQ